MTLCIEEKKERGAERGLGDPLPLGHRAGRSGLGGSSDPVSSSRHRLTDLNLKQETDVSLCLQLARERAQARSPTAGFSSGSSLGKAAGSAPGQGCVLAAFGSHLD